MKRTAVLMAAVAVVGLILFATIPALAQERVTEPEVTCPYHNQADMPGEGMAEWMDSAAHDDWMQSAGHGQMHEAMNAAGYGQMHEAMNGAGNMMGGGNMMNDPLDR